MRKDLNFGLEALKKLALGAQKLNDAVAVTMGAGGKTVVIDTNFGAMPKITKDGITVAKNVDLDDLVESTGVTLIRDASNRTNEVAGDGSTTSIVLANEILQQGLSAVESGYRMKFVKKGMELELMRVLNEIKKNSVVINSVEEMKNVANISANGDIEVATLVSHAYEQVGKDGKVAIEVVNNSPVSYFEREEGINYNRGFISPFFKNTPSGNYEGKDVNILITDYSINSALEIEEILNFANSSKKPLLIVCEDMSPSVTEIIARNKFNGFLDICITKTPEFGDRRIDFLQDLAIFTGGKYVSSVAGMKLTEANASHLGKCDKVIISTESSAIIGGKGNPESIKERLVEIKLQIENSKDEEIKAYEKKRYARVQDGVGIIKIGGVSDLEKLELRDRVEDAVNAVKSALAEGVIIGGGTLLFKIGEKGIPTKDISKFSNHVNKGRSIFLNAIKKPFFQIIENADLNTGEVVELLKGKPKNYVFNVDKSVAVNGFKAGIIDPALVTIEALKNAVSISGTILTTGCSITNRADD